MGFHVGQIFGEYEVTAVLGAGSMGRVYRVEHCLTKRTEAMKVLSSEVASDIQIKRFEREMRALAKLNHPNIAVLHNALSIENQLVLLMEFVEGQTLESMFAAGRLPRETGIEYVKSILSALGYAHRQGVVHRDATPANVIITPDGQVKLTDFGLSKSYDDSLVTSCGEVLGSLAYLAPEQLKGATQPDRRSDLYAVGAILYEHLTGQKPFGRNRRLAAVLTDAEQDPAAASELDPSVSREWDELLRRALAKDPARRYQSAEEFLEAIAKTEPRPKAVLPLRQMRSAGIGVAALAAVALALFATPELSRFHKAEPVKIPWQRLHIAPPAFATLETPAEPRQGTTPTEKRAGSRLARRPLKGAHADLDAHAQSFSSGLSAGSAVHALPAPVLNSALPVPVLTPTPAPALSAPAAASIQAAANAGPSQESQQATPHKKGFWGKLFHKPHSGAPAETKTSE